MADDMERRLRMLEARMDALVQLTLSHIVASDTAGEGVARITIGIAENQRREAIDQGKHLTGIVLGDLLAELRDVCDLPPPD